MTDSTKHNSNSGKIVSPSKSRHSPAKENIPPISCAQLYQDKSLYTQELSQKAVASNDLASVSFLSEEEEGLNSSLGKMVDTAMQMTDTFTPVKQTIARTPQSKKVLTPSNMQFPLPPSSPALTSRPP